MVKLVDKKRNEVGAGTNVSSVSGIIIEDGNYQDSFQEPHISGQRMGIDFQYNYQGASLEKNDTEDNPELTKPVFP